MCITKIHTHTLRMAIFPGEFGLAGCPLILLLNLFQDCASFWDRPKLSMSFLTQSHQVFFGHPLCLIPSNSHGIQHLTQPVISFGSTCPNHLNLLTVWSSNWLVPILRVLWDLHFSSFHSHNPTHPSDHTHFSVIQLQFMLYFHRPSLTAMHQTTPHRSNIYTLPLSFNENPFLIIVGKYLRNFFQADLTLAVTAESHPPSASNISPK